MRLLAPIALRFDFFKSMVCALMFDLIPPHCSSTFRRQSVRRPPNERGALQGTDECREKGGDWCVVRRRQFVEPYFYLASQLIRSLVHLLKRFPRQKEKSREEEKEKVVMHIGCIIRKGIRADALDANRLSRYLGPCGRHGIPLTPFLRIEIIYKERSYTTSGAL